MEKRLKTPLRYPGGKSKAIHKLFANFPNLENVKDYREPFIGGGSVAIHISRLNPDCSVWVNDLYWPLYNFWIHLRDHGDKLSDDLYQMKMTYNTHDTARDLFNSSKLILNGHNDSDYSKAIAFWVVNKCSFSGLTEMSSFPKGASDKNFTVSGINALKEYSKHIKNWKITNVSYEELLNNTENDTFIYLDPPYEIHCHLYGKKGSMHKGFDHDLFADLCNRPTQAKIAVSYNSDQSVKERFPDWNQIEFDLTYSMRTDRKNYRNNQADRKELLLTNYS